MTITQTIDVPDTRRITLEVPSEIPAGPTIIAFTPAAAPQWNVETIAAAEEAKAMMQNRKTSKRFNSREELKTSLKEILEN